MLKTIGSEDLLIQTVEISDSEDLIETYGVRIPVLKLEGTEQELGWPFTQEELLAFLR